MASARIRMNTAVRLLAGGGLVCWAAMASPMAPSPARAADPELDDLQRQLQESRRQLENRDEVINDLLRRVGELERRVSGPLAMPAPDAYAPLGAMPAAMRTLPEPPARSRRSLLAQQPAAPDAGGGTAAQPKPGQAPGAVDVDAEAAERALERTLVAGGALLLTVGQAEFEPSFNYTRRETGVPALVDLGGDLVAQDQNQKRDEMTTTLAFRIGLPWDSQLELGVPYNVVYEQRTINLGASGRFSEGDTGAALGDVSVGIAKTIFREKGWRPDLVARVTYDSNTGDKFDNGVALNGGFNDLQGSLTAVKRQDPLAFVGTVAYQHSFEDDNIQPGDEYTLSLGTILAVSPQTSLRFFLQQQYVDSVELNGRNIENSDQRLATAQIGLSTVMGRGVLLDIVGGIGLTNDSPDYFLGLSLPVRFSIPVPQNVMP